MLHEFENGLFDAGVAQRFAGRSLIATCKKVFHLENALGRGHVFAGHRAANRGLMHPDDFSDFCHRHRLQMCWAVLEEIALPRNDLLRDVHNRLLPLMDRADQKFAAADFVPDVIFGVAALRVAGSNNVLVQIADPQMGNLFIVEGGLILAVHLFHDHVRQHVILRRGSENLAGTRIQSRDVIGSFLHFLDADRHSTRDLHKTVPAQVIHVLGHDSVLEALFLALSAQLDQQTLA